MIYSFSLLPDSTSIISPFNACLGVPHLIENCDMTCFLNNDDITRVCGLLFHKDSEFSDLNKLVSLAISGVTSSMRFQSEQRLTIRYSNCNNTYFKEVVNQFDSFSSITFHKHFFCSTTQRVSGYHNSSN
jgi:hypothetical protein